MCIIDRGGVILRSLSLWSNTIFRSWWMMGLSNYVIVRKHIHTFKELWLKTINQAIFFILFKEMLPPPSWYYCSTSISKLLNLFQLFEVAMFLLTSYFRYPWACFWYDQQECIGPSFYQTVCTRRSWRDVVSRIQRSNLRCLQNSARIYSG